MVALRFTSPHGRYHATPWGHHVNEGLVEWPPSPWRILRTLIATGYTKLGWTEMPVQAAELVTALASALPTYRLPPATAAHTRHYMPIIEGKKQTTTKVIDAFVRTQRGASICVVWPVALSPAAATLLSVLVGRVTYLGRAESRVVADVVSELPPGNGIEAVPCEQFIEGCDPIRLLAPMPHEEYEIWRRNQLSAAAPEAPKKGGRRRARPGEPLLPPDVVRALEADTGALQAAGWSDPPGSRRVLYWRTEGALDHRSSGSPVRVANRPWVDTALLALSSNTSRGEVLPLLTRALPQAELLHRALVSKLGDPPRNCPELSGKSESGSKLLGHRHVHFVPLDLDGDRRLDHILLWAPMGFGEAAVQAIRSLRRTWTKGGDSALFVTLAGLGRRADLEVVGGVTLREITEGTVWVSRTPFVPPRHIKAKRHRLEDQVQDELASRGLPAAVGIDISDAKVAWGAGFHRFVRVRRNSERQPPSPAFFHLRIQFGTSVRGPLMLGYASHFGLGQFVPADPQGK